MTPMNPKPLNYTLLWIVAGVSFAIVITLAGIVLYHQYGCIPDKIIKHG